MKIVLYFIIAAALAMIVAHVADAKNNTLGKTGCDGFPKAHALAMAMTDIARPGAGSSKAPMMSSAPPWHGSWATSSDTSGRCPLITPM